MMNFKIQRIDSPIHRKWIASKACIITGLTEGVQSHHLMRAEPIKGIGRKLCDRWCIPLHHAIHDALHKNGNEIVFFANHGIDYEEVKNLASVYASLSPDKRIREAMRIWELNNNLIKE